MDSERPRAARLNAAVIALAMSLPVATGCSEAMMKKFVRQPKEQSRPSPIVHFDEYAGSTAPPDLYRKHYTVFSYWSAELLDALLPTGNNPRRVKRASQETLQRLETLVGLLDEPYAAQVRPLLDEQRALDRQLQDPVDDHAQAALLRQRVELQQRRINRYMAMSKVADHLRGAGAKAPRVAADTAAPPAAKPADAR